MVYVCEFEFWTSPDGNMIAEPLASFGHEPRHGGHVIAVAVSRQLDDIPAMTAADAARELGVTNWESLVGESHSFATRESLSHGDSARGA